MILDTGIREIELIFRAKKMKELGEKLKGDTYVHLTKGAILEDIAILVLLIKTFNDNKLSEEDCYSAIDECLQNGIALSKIYADIFDGINKNGFFSTNPLMLKPSIDEFLQIKAQMVFVEMDGTALTDTVMKM
ncbi:MAG: hypothetical protein RR623_03985 [Bacilli bacterium]